MRRWGFRLVTRT